MKAILASARWARTAVGAIALMAAIPGSMVAQNVTVFGALSNFDVYNDTGYEAHGFEIELEGVQPNSTPYAFTATRYGAPKYVPTATGVIVRWSSAYDAANQRFTTATTIPAVLQPTGGHSCVLTSVAGCDHYGLVVGYGNTSNPTNTTYYWMIEDSANPGTLVRYKGAPVQIPQPIVSVVNQVGVAPQVAFQIQAPVPPPPPIPKPVPQHGEAKWVKVYKTELQHEVALEDLVGNNPDVPQDPGKVETGWKLLQFNPNSNGNSGILRNQGGVNGGSRSVLRRYEFYKFSGAYDPIDHAAICADGTCSNPAPSEIGDFIGAQNAAANIGVPSVTVSVVGDGQVSTANNDIRCPGACAVNTAVGSVVTLTAKNGKDTFAKWTGACEGSNPVCSVTVNDSMATVATFLTPYRLTLRTSGTGTLTSNPASTGAILSGTVVTLTATPGAGQSLSSWTGPCVGSGLSCTFTMTADTAVTATFTGPVAPPPASTFKLVLKANGKGTVVSNPSGTAFASGTVVKLTATPDAGVPFVGWSGGGCSGTVPVCSVTITADTTVTANFR